MSPVLFCTYCSGEKRRDRRDIPAIRRYRSPRISAVLRESRKKGATFAILSGRFGLIGPYRKIPFYDHLLRHEEVESLLPQMVDYIRKKRVRSVRFFHEPLARDSNLGPYCEAVKRACGGAGVALEMIELS